MEFREYIIRDIKRVNGEPIREFHQNLIGRRCYFLETPFYRYPAYIKVEFPEDKEFTWHTVATTPVELMSFDEIALSGTLTTMNSVYYLEACR